MGRVRLVIDGDNLFVSQIKLGWKVDYQKLLKWAESYGDLVGASFYGAYKEGEEESKQGFYGALRSARYQIFTKPLKEFRKVNGEMTYQSPVDVLMARDIILSIPQTDLFIIMTGDSDFSPILETIESMGKDFVLVSTHSHVANSLKDLAGFRYVDVGDLRDKIELLRE